MYKIIEKSCIGKINQSKCEDGLYISKNIVAVIDGGSPKGIKTWKNNQTSGWYCKEIILEALKKVDENWSNKKIIEFINKQVNKAYENNEAFFYKHPEEQLQAGIIFYNDLRKEVVSYGDCMALINNDYYSHSKLIDTISTGLRSFYLKLNEMNAIPNQKNDIETYGRSVIEDIIKKQSYFSNLDDPLGFPVINGLKLNLKQMVVHKIKNKDKIVLASDGYIKLLPTLKQSEKHLFKTLKEDPYCYKNFMATKGWKKGFKSFDDRTYIKLLVTN